MATIVCTELLILYKVLFGTVQLSVVRSLQRSGFPINN